DGDPSDVAAEVVQRLPGHALVGREEDGSRAPVAAGVLEVRALVEVVDGAGRAVDGAVRVDRHAVHRVAGVAGVAVAERLGGAVAHLAAAERRAADTAGGGPP